MARRARVAVGAALLGAGLLAVGLLAALVGVRPSSGPVTDPPSVRIAASRTSADAPADFVERRPLRSCGEFVVGFGDVVPAAALDCLRDGGELAVASSTIEGDRTITFFRTGDGIRGGQVFVDGTRDRFGSGDWTRDSCPTRGVTPQGWCA